MSYEEKSKWSFFKNKDKIESPRLKRSVFHSIADGNNSRLSKILGRRPVIHKDDLNGPLLEAVRISNLDCVRSLVSSGADPNTTDEEGKSALMLLMEFGGGQPHIMKDLLKTGADPNLSSWSLQQAALHIAAKKGYQVCVNELIRAGADINISDCAGNTPLMYASKEGHIPILKMLLKHKANINVKNMVEETALHHSARGNQVECVYELLAAGSNPNIRDNRGQTPLYFACKHKHSKIIQILLDFHCDVNVQDTQSGRTSLHWAVYNEDLFTVSLLLNNGADTNIRDTNWLTPFMMALGGKKEILKLVLSEGCDVSVTDKNFNTALHLAAREGQEDNVDLLLWSGAATDLKGASGMTPLMLASLGGHVNIVDKLLTFGASPDMLDRHHATALTYAVLSDGEYINKLQIIKMLISCNCNFNQRFNLSNIVKMINSKLFYNFVIEERFYSICEIAFLQGHVEIFQMLIKAGCDLSNFHCENLTVSNNVYDEGLDLRNNWFLIKVVQTEKKRVRSLKELCRKPVLTRLKQFSGGTLMDKISLLSVSDQLKGFLRFNDLDDVSNQKRKDYKNNTPKRSSSFNSYDESPRRDDHFYGNKKTYNNSHNKEMDHKTPESNNNSVKKNSFMYERKTSFRSNLPQAKPLRRTNSFNEHSITRNDHSEDYHAVIGKSRPMSPPNDRKYPLKSAEFSPMATRNSSKSTFDRCQSPYSQSMGQQYSHRSSNDKQNSEHSVQSPIVKRPNSALGNLMRSRTNSGSHGESPKLIKRQIATINAAIVDPTTNETFLYQKSHPKLSQTSSAPHQSESSRLPLSPKSRSTSSANSKPAPRPKTPTSTRTCALRYSQSRTPSVTTHSRVVSYFTPSNKHSKDYDDDVNLKGVSHNTSSDSSSEKLSEPDSRFISFIPLEAEQTHSAKPKAVNRSLSFNRERQIGSYIGMNSNQEDTTTHSRDDRYDKENFDEIQYENYKNRIR